jgi:HEAT repeat protein
MRIGPPVGSLKSSYFAMTNRNSANPVRLEEIHRLAVRAEADESRALAIAAGKRRVFGPLLYSTLVIAAIVTIYVGAIRVGELVDQERMRPGELSPDRVVATSLVQLQDKRWQTRAAAVKGIGNALLRYGPGDHTSGPRGEAMLALRNALADSDGPVRAEAADALGNSPQFGKLAKGELTLALKDEDPTVKLAAARALLHFQDESSATALRALGELLTDPMGSSDRIAVVSIMKAEGTAGRDAAVKALATMLASRDEVLRSDALAGMTALGPEAAEIAPALERLLGAGDREVRYTAALAAARLTYEGQKSAPRLILILEAALTDKALAASLRENALQELSRLSRVSLGRCGRELARQLEHPNYNVRFEAASLLHMIDPEALAEKDGPVTGP